VSVHPFDRLAISGGGTLIFTPCPGTKGVDLQNSLVQLKAAGAEAVITLMSWDEMARNGVTELPDACRETDLQWFHFPIEDNAPPEEAFRQPWERDKKQIFKILDRSENVAIHCKGGSGRTGLMAAIILCERGMHHDLVLDQVKSLRPNALKLAAHTDYLLRVCKSMD